MERLAKQRQPVRAAFTRNFNSLKQSLDGEQPNREEIESKLASLERIAIDLGKLDVDIFNVLLEGETNEKQFNDEYACCEEYREKLDNARIRVKAYLNKFMTAPIDVMMGNLEKTKLKLPQLELAKFGGDVKDWLNFWSQFKRIDEDPLMEKEDKFQYLIQCMIVGSRAREIVDSYPPTAENYSKCIESLKTRFGREELLVEFYVRELLALVVKNVTNMKNAVNIMQLYDKLESYLRSLESIGMTSDKYAAMLFPLVESCIPEDILRVWLRSPGMVKEDDSYGKKLTQLLLFLRTEVEGEERISLAKAGFRQNESVGKFKKPKGSGISTPTANDLFLGSSKENTKLQCIFCARPHESRDCFKGQTMSYEDKTDILKKNKACFSCLKSGHRSKFCKANVRCLICSKKHWAILCPDLLHMNKTPAENINGGEQNVTLSNQCHSNEVLLQTLLVSIGTYGKTRTVRAIIDTGSQRSYLLKSTADALQLKPVGSEILNHVVFGGSTSRKEHKRYDLKVIGMHNKYSLHVDVLDQTTICGTIPRIKEGRWINELKEKGIQLTDVGTNNQQIELLIGADFAGKLYTGQMLKLECGLVAMQTHLGWIIMGQVSRGSVGNYATSLLLHTDDITKLWNLEAIGITDPYETPLKEEMEAVVQNHFQNTVRIDQEGRYEVCLPWMINRDELTTNKEIAEKRLMSTTSKLIKENKYESYDAVFGEWTNEGIISIGMGEDGHFLPHRGVFKLNSSTAVRPVFDASCKQKGSLCLNDCLAKGPNLLELIPSILIKFREKRIGVISDIKRAFLQISISEEDRNFLKFLWWEDSRQKVLKILQHCRVVFGLNCSPFLLGAVIHHHLAKYSSSSQANIAEKLKGSFYVDNCVTSVNTNSELETFIEGSTKIMAEAKFDLRGWEHSASETVSHHPVPLKPTSVLGLLWDRTNDTLFCDISSIKKPEGPITRRVILSVAHRVFDPIGFTCPVVLCLKLLLQDSWKEKTSWDSEVSPDIALKFWKWFDEIDTLSAVKIPRHAFLYGSPTLTLHTFCDASGSSYAAVVYLRCETTENVSIQLLMAKSRIAPLRKITIPRLELLSCCIGARLAQFVKHSLNLECAKEFYWTDSSTALHWIKRDEPWGVFVHNRIKEIRELTLVQNWNHIPGRFNPADLPSRGCSARKLLKSLWWEGPYWLRADEDSWPVAESVYNEVEISAERKSCTNIALNEPPTDGRFISYFSSYTKNIRMIGWIRRFISNARKSNNTRRGELTVDEFLEAEKRILSVVQKEAFPEDFCKKLKSLNVFKDDEGLWRVKTRLVEREDTYEFKFPIVLPSHHKLVHKLIREHHLTMMHAGLQILLASLRERFWILDGRRTVRKVLNQCVRCRRHTSTPLQTVPATLPKDRVGTDSAFAIIGVDLAGPLILRGGEKSWVVLFTCATYRAIHLELITSSSTEAFLLGFRRFIARRGRPSIVYSDNGTNFVGANNLMKTLDWNLIEKESFLKKIQWNFSPPSAPWWGGFWERLVRMMKEILRRVLGKTSLRYEELNSILCECEAVVNSRPLTYLSEDTQDLIPLTPSMFIQDLTNMGVSDLDELDRQGLSKRLKYRQKLKEDLRKRFRLEYLGRLTELGGKGKSLVVKVGDVVIIETDSKKRTFWPLAKVVELYPGKDGIVRVVKLRTSSGELIRPVRKLYPLEVSNDVELYKAGNYEGAVSFIPTTDIDKTSEILNKAISKTESASDQNTAISVETRCGRKIKLPKRYMD